MNDELRLLIRELLREEINSIRSELSDGPAVELVSVSTAAALTEFALSVLERAHEPGFAAALRKGRLKFAPEGPVSVPRVQSPVPQPERLVASEPVRVPELKKGLITERDIAGLPEDEKRLRVTKAARLTPLAGDEVRRRGIRIERTLT